MKTEQKLYKCIYCENEISGLDSGESMRQVCNKCQNYNRNRGESCHACRGDAGYVTHTCDCDYHTEVRKGLAPNVPDIHQKPREGEWEKEFDGLELRTTHSNPPHEIVIRRQDAKDFIRSLLQAQEKRLMREFDDNQ